MSLLIVGCGYVGRAVANAWQARGESVWALTRGGSAQSELASLGITPIAANWLETPDRWQLPRDQPAPRFALVAVPHRAEPGLDERTHVVGLEHLSRALPAIERLVVLSTTGVYHQNDGSLVDEDSPVAPTRIGPQIALAAEKWVAEQWVAAHGKGRGCSLRLAGIYGPNRVPLVAKLKASEPIPSGSGWLNLIHLDDIIAAVLKLFEHPNPGLLYVLSDGQPVERRQFYTDAARIFHTPPPIFSVLEGDSSRSARAESNKRINPARIMNELGLNLKYPNHLAGLSALA